MFCFSFKYHVKDCLELRELGMLRRGEGSGEIWELRAGRADLRAEEREKKHLCTLHFLYENRKMLHIELPGWLDGRWQKTFPALLAPRKSPDHSGSLTATPPTLLPSSLQLNSFFFCLRQSLPAALLLSAALLPTACSWCSSLTASIRSWSSSAAAVKLQSPHRETAQPNTGFTGSQPAFPPIICGLFPAVRPGLLLGYQVKAQHHSWASSGIFLTAEMVRSLFPCKSKLKTQLSQDPVDDILLWNHLGLYLNLLFWLKIELIPKKTGSEPMLWRSSFDHDPPEQINLALTSVHWTAQVFSMAWTKSFPSLWESKSSKEKPSSQRRSSGGICSRSAAQSRGAALLLRHWCGLGWDS